jgi:hypothetical protein
MGTLSVRGSKLKGRTAPRAEPGFDVPAPPNVLIYVDVSSEESC